MPVWLDVLEDAGDSACSVDHERRAQYAHVLASHGRLLSPDPVQPGYVMPFFRQKREGQRVFLAEARVRG